MLAGFLQNHIDRSAAMQKVGWTVCVFFLYVYCLTEYHMRFRWSLRLAIGEQMHGWCHRSIFLCFVQRSAQFWKSLQVYCGSSRLKPQLKLSSVRVRKKHLATARDALTPKLEQNLQQPYASWRNLWSILEHTLTRLRVGLDQTCRIVLWGCFWRRSVPSFPAQPCNSQ